MAGAAAATTRRAPEHHTTSDYCAQATLTRAESLPQLAPTAPNRPGPRQAVRSVRGRCAILLTSHSLEEV